MFRHTGLILASPDPTALDVSQSIIMGYDPLTIPLTRELKNRNLTSWIHIDDIEYPLLHASDLVFHDYKRIKQEKRTRLFGSLLSPLFTRRIKLHHRRHEPKPLFDNDLCIGCGRCVKICPAKALSLDKERHIVADYSACIRCYCCHEVCPVDAITIETNEGIN
jgi:NAD-dependent dihydropyrimidine dehydrogenase PreA subunit